MTAAVGRYARTSVKKYVEIVLDNVKYTGWDTSLVYRREKKKTVKNTIILRVRRRRRRFTAVARIGVVGKRARGFPPDNTRGPRTFGSVDPIGRARQDQRVPFAIKNKKKRKKQIISIINPYGLYASPVVDLFGSKYKRNRHAVNYFSCVLSVCFAFRRGP